MKVGWGWSVTVDHGQKPGCSWSMAAALNMLQRPSSEVGWWRSAAGLSWDPWRRWVKWGVVGGKMVLQFLWLLLLLLLRGGVVQEGNSTAQLSPDAVLNLVVPNKFISIVLFSWSLPLLQDAASTSFSLFRFIIPPVPLDSLLCRAINCTYIYIFLHISQSKIWRPALIAISISKFIHTIYIEQA